MMIIQGDRAQDYFLRLSYQPNNEQKGWQKSSFFIL